MKLSILFVGEYKEYPYMVQVLHSQDNQYTFQYIIHKEGKGFFQGHNIITADKQGEELTQEQIIQSTVLMKDFAITTIETLLRKDDPNYVPTDAERLGQEVVDIVENLSNNEKKLKSN